MEALESCSVPNDTLSEVDVLLETIQREGAQRRKATRSAKLLCVAVCCLILGGALVDVSKGKPFDYGSVLIVASTLGCGFAYGLTPGLRQALTRAATLYDLRLLGGMIEALDSGEPKLRKTLEEVSTTLLEQVQPADLGLLDDYQLDQLLRAVRLSSNKRFVSSAIKTMGRIGSKRTLQALEIFINDPSLSPKRRAELEPYLCTAMADLRIRIAEERVSGRELEPLTPAAKILESASGLQDQVKSWFTPQVGNQESGQLPNRM
jgi:hypothetical protein